MATIKPYESPIESLRSGEQGAEAFAGAGRRIGAFYRETGQELSTSFKDAGAVADRVLTHQQVSHFDLGSAGTLAKLDQSWNQLIASGVDPNDPTIADKFMSETVEPALEQLGNGVTNEGAQRYAQSRVDELRNHFQTKTAAEMSNLAGVAVSTNLDRVGNTLSKVAFDDPTSTKMSLKQYQNSVDAQIATSNMNAEGIAGLRRHQQETMQKIAASGVAGFIYKNPSADYSTMTKDPAIAPYLAAVEPKQLQQSQQNQQRYVSAVTRQENADKERQQTNQNNDFMNQTVTNHLHLDANGKLVPDAGYFSAIREAQTRPGMHPGMLPEMANFGDKLAKDAITEDRVSADDPATKDALNQKILDGQDVTQDLMRARVNDKITDRSFKEGLELNKASQQDPESLPGIKDTLAGVKSSIVSPLLPGQKDARGDQLYADFKADFAQKVIGMGKDDRQKASNFSDPNSLVNQMLKSPKYNRTPQDRLRDMMVGMGVGAPVGKAPLTDSTTAPKAAAPTVGTIKNGFRFKGGDASTPGAWEPVK